MEKILQFLKKAAIPALYIAFAAALDQLVKNWAEANLPGSPVTVVEDVFYLTYATNDGAAWSILSGSRAVLLIITLAAFVLIAYLFKAGHMHTRLLRVSMYSVIGGAIGNFIDRMFRPSGLVVDLFDFRLIHFPIFNIADIFITVGGTLFVLAYLVDFVKTERENKAKARDAAGSPSEDTHDPD